MFVNLDQLPPGKHMFTVYVTDQPVGTPQDDLFYDEVDAVADHGANVYTIVGSMRREDLEAYDGQRVIGIADQSGGFLVLQDSDSTLKVVK